MESVRVLDLSYLYMKKKIPPKAIQNLTQLRFLDLSSTGIEALSDSSLQNHYHLQALHIRQPVTRWKFQFVKLPGCINKLINLRHLNADAKTIVHISDIGQLINLQELDEYSVDETEGHKITELKNLRELTGHLRVNNCGKIKSREEAEQAILADKKYLHSVEFLGSSDRNIWNPFPYSIAPGESILGKEILEGLKPYGGIKELTIMDYRDSSFPDWLTDRNHFSNLQRICLYSCRNITVLPHLGQLPLSKLEIINFWDVEEAPRHCFPASLKTLNIAGCPKLNSLAESLHHLTALISLHILDINITSLDLYGLTLLEHLDLEKCPELSIEGNLHSLTKLKDLKIISCPKLNSNRMTDIMGKGKGEAQPLLSLSLLVMDRSLWHNDYHLTLGRFPSLRSLHFRDSQQQGHLTEDQSLWFGELTALQVIEFWNCGFTQLPSSLAMLSSLKKVTLVLCTKLESLHGSGMPPSLWELNLWNCSKKLVERCQPDEGGDWRLIAHVPCIRINGRLINWPQSSAGTSGS